MKVFHLIIFSLAFFLNNVSFAQVNKKNMQTKEIYFAGGCFWGTEHFLKQIRGVVSTEVGYANGITQNPSYREVSQGNTQFAETVKVIYKPEEVSLPQLIELYFKTIDPTSLNKQGNDIGTQYRTGIFYTDKSDQALIKNLLNNLSSLYKKPIVVENLPLKNFYPAEEYHQRKIPKAIVTFLQLCLKWLAKQTQNLLRLIQKKNKAPLRKNLPLYNMKLLKKVLLNLLLRMNIGMRKEKVSM